MRKNALSFILAITILVIDISYLTLVYQQRRTIKTLVLSLLTLSFDDHVLMIVNKARKYLGMIQRTFYFKESDIILSLFKSHVRPLLDYCSIIWCPYRLKNSKLIEGIQRSLTKRLPNMKHLSYKDSLRKLYLLSMHARRIRYKLIFLYKLINGHLDLDPTVFFEFHHNYSTRGNDSKIRAQFALLDLRQHFFCVDVIPYWNNMTKSEISVSTVQLFKKSVDSLFVRLQIW